MKPRIGTHIRNNLVGYTALFVALGGSSAWAVNGPLAAKNTVRSAAIVDGQVKRADLAASAVTSAKVANGTLKKADFAPGALAAGARGPEGPQGPAGPRGPQGSSGPAGGDGGGTASGPAGGDLSGKYPNPLVGPNAIGSAEVVNDSLTAADLAPGSVGTSEVADNALTGTDVNESTLAQVPSALLGGLGRGASKKGFPDDCAPTGTAFGTCVDVAVDLPARTRVLVIGSLTALGPAFTDGLKGGTCRLGTSAAGAIAGTATFFVVRGGGSLSSDQSDHGTLIGITPPLGPGPVSFGIDCNNQVQHGGLRYTDAMIAAVAISPS